MADVSTKEADQQALSPSSPARRIELDRLRSLACLTTIVLHTLQIFSTDPYYHIKSVVVSAAFDPWLWLLHALRMPIFFLIAGMVAFIAIGRASNKEFLRGRAVRLLPPFVLGIFLFAPWIKYFEVLDGRTITWHGIVYLTEPAPSPPVLLWRFFLHFFKFFSWSHMWFLAYLLLLSALMLPVLRFMQRSRADPTTRTGLVAALSLAALIAIELILRPYFPRHIPNLFWDWANVAVYIACFIAGAAVVRWPELQSALQRALPLAALAAAVGLVLFVVLDKAWPHTGIGRALWLWGMLALALGAGPVLARGTIPGERYVGEGALPLYVLHHLPLVAIGFYVKDLALPYGVRFAIIVAAAFIVTFTAYHFLVRPYNTMRFLFGMPPRRDRVL